MRSLKLLLWITLATGALLAADKPRVFITDSKSWEISGASGGSSAGFGGGVHGGARPQTAEIIKTFGDRCPDVVVNNKQEKADYVVLSDHEGGKSLLRKDNKVAVFNRGGDSILSHSTRSLGSSVQDACNAITKDWPAQAATAVGSASSEPTMVQAAATTSKPAAVTRIAVSSNPDKADIEVDGNFVGSTPSSVELAPGAHVIRVTKSGYSKWQRTLNVGTSSVNVSAELEKPN
jgi:hypothetical protein